MIPFSGPVPAAGTYVYELAGMPINVKYITLRTNFVMGAAGGATIDVFLQTTFDGGNTWEDVSCSRSLLVSVMKVRSLFYGWPSPGAKVAQQDGTLGADSDNNGLFGYKWRVKIIVAGAYAADSTIRVDVNFMT